MRTPFSNKELGTSIIELMIASSLLAVIGLAAGAFFKRINASDMEARARSSTISEITLFLSTIERDFKLRYVPTDPTAPPIGPICASCTSFSVDRIVRLASGTDQKMTVDYQSFCASSPGGSGSAISQKLNKAFDDTKTKTSLDASGRSIALNGECYSRLKCSAGQYPAVRIIPHNPGGGAEMPSYPRFNGTSAQFPNLQSKQSLASGVVGAVICGDGKASSRSDRIVLEAAFFNSEGLLRIEKREVSIPRSNVANIQMLPSKAP